MDSPATTTWLEIDLGAIRDNARLIQKLTGKPLFAVVKANGYGHGLVEVGRAALRAGAVGLCVARLEEALTLRQAGLGGLLLVLGYTPPERVSEAVRADISLTVYDPDLATAASSAALQTGKRVKVHAKIDTGMGRLGVFPEVGVEFLRELQALPGLDVEGLFTHFACADDTGRAVTLRQLAGFQSVVDGAQSAGLRPRWVHAANSPAAFYYPEARFDAVRCGIAMYGIDPAEETPLPAGAGFRPALTWKARVISVKRLPPGQGIGYNHRYHTQAEELIGVVAAGYCDGLPRRLGNFALVSGRRVSMIGGMCMDQCMIHLDPGWNVQVGDEVVLIGRQAGAAITAEELGKAWNTSNHAVVSGVMARVPRIYLND